MDLTFSPKETAFRDELRGWLAENQPDPEPTEGGEDAHYTWRRDWQRRLYDAGWAAPAWPTEYGGRGATPTESAIYYEEIGRARVPFAANTLGLLLGGPTLMVWGTPEQKERYLPPILSAEEIWCQGFSEPDAGSDLAALKTRAVKQGDDWIVTGQKVWTSGAQYSKWCMLVARTDGEVAKHKGLTYFLMDMEQEAVQVRPLRQITGEAEFNEVFLTDVTIPDTDRIGTVGAGWKVSTATLMNERVSIGGAAVPREGGMIGSAARTWRERPELRTPGLHDAMLRLWAAAEVARLAGERLRQQLAVGHPGPEGSAAKLVFARLNQEISGFELELAGADGLRYGDWTMRRPDTVNFYGRDAGYRYLRAKGNSIEGGTSEILRNIIAERVLALPPEIRVDTSVPWKDLPR